MARDPARCRTGKVRYRDRVAALVALAQVRRTDSPNRPKQEVRAYRCPLCRGWHLTARRGRRAA
jgi:hypothetical protein